MIKPQIVQLPANDDDVFAQSGGFLASPLLFSTPFISQRWLHFSGNPDLSLRPRAHLNYGPRRLWSLTDHLQVWSDCSLLVRAGVLFVRSAAAQLGSALSPTGELAQGVSRLWAERDKLGLDGGGVDALVVEEVLDAFGHLHVRCGVVAFDVRRGDDAASGQLPDVQLVDGQDAVQAQQTLVEPVHVDLLGHGLQQDEGRLFEQRVGSVQQDAHHDDAQRGIKVKNPAGAGELHGRHSWTHVQIDNGVVVMVMVSGVAVDARIHALLTFDAGLPHKGEYYSIDHYDDGAQGVAQHMQEDPAHVELRRRVVVGIHLLIVGVSIHLHLCAAFTADF